MREKLRFYVSSHSLKEEMKKLKEGIKGDDKVMLGIPINLLKDAEVVEMSVDKTKKKEGEVTQYYVKDSHLAIIPKEDWEMVQIEIERRKALKFSYSKKNQFLGKLICEDCGGYYGKKVCHSRRKEIVQCNNKFTKKCKTPTLTEDDVKARLLKAYSSMFINKDEMISNIELVKARIIDTTEIDNKISKLNDELQGLAKDIETLVKENTKTLKDQEI